MNRLWIVLLVLALAGSVSAGGYRIAYQSADARLNSCQPTRTNPILDNDGALVGFTHSHGDGATVLVDLLNGERDSAVVANTLSAAISCFIGDTLVTYAFSFDFTQDKVSRIVWIDDSAIVTQTTVSEYYWPQPSFSLLDCRITFDSTNGARDRVIFTPRYYMQGRELGRGWQYFDIAHSFCYSLNLIEDRAPIQSNYLKFGVLYEGGTEAVVTSNNEGYSYDWYDGTSGSTRWLEEVAAEYEDDNVLANTTSNHGWCEGMFVGDFTEPWGIDEVVSTGYTKTWLNNRSVDTRTTICYSFASGSAQEIWARDNDYEYTNAYASADLGLLAGLVNNQSVYLWSLRDGRLVDSIQLNRAFGYHLGFFETGTSVKELHMLARTGDTLFVLSFGSPTDVDDDAPPVLPTSFTLHQNYPNPFNAGTVISFDNHISQRVTLEIVNTLGQHVLTLCNKVMSAGSYRFEWNGRGTNGKELASGVYFARLRTDIEEHSIKMALVK